MIRSVVRRMMALALVSAKFISTLFDNLGNDLCQDERDALAPLFKYFMLLAKTYFYVQYIRYT